MADDAEASDERARQSSSAVSPDGTGSDVASTVGTGSVLGIGCLVAVVLFVAIAVAIRWFGGSW